MPHSADHTVKDEGCHRARSPQRHRGSGLRVCAGAALRRPCAPRRAVRGEFNRASSRAAARAIAPETRARAQVSRLSPLRMADDSGPTSGRRGISVDQDGKSNIWSIEPTMKVVRAPPRAPPPLPPRPFVAPPPSAMPLSPRRPPARRPPGPERSASRHPLTGRGGEQRQERGDCRRDRGPGRRADCGRVPLDPRPEPLIGSRRFAVCT